MSNKAHRQRLIGTALIVVLSIWSEFMVLLVTPKDVVFFLVAVAVVLIGVSASMVLLFYRADGRGLRFAPSWWGWGALCLSAVGIFWMSGWLLILLPSIMAVFVVLLYRLEPFSEPVERVVIREVTEEEHPLA